MTETPVSVRTPVRSNGKFCRLLGPVSLSLGSFGVTPSGPRSIPRKSLETIRLANNTFPPLELGSRTPRELNAIRLGALAAPTWTLLAEAPIETPWPPLPRSRLPLLSVPIRLFWIVVEVAVALLRLTPSVALAEITLRSAAVGPPTRPLEAVKTTPEPFPAAVTPSVASPMKLPEATPPLTPAAHRPESVWPPNESPLPRNPVTARPRIVVLLAQVPSPVVLAPAFTPSNRIRSRALLAVGSVLAAVPFCE